MNLWVINAVDVATENKIHCHLHLILVIKIVPLSGLFCTIIRAFLLGISPIWSVPGKFCSNKRDVRLSMVRI